MGYLSSNEKRTVLKLGFERRANINNAMRQAIALMMDDSYIDLCSKNYDFGLGKPVRTPREAELPALDGFYAPTAVIALRVDARRDIIALVYEFDDYFFATLGASFNVHSTVDSYYGLNLNDLSWNEDRTVAEVNGLRTLYADGIDCIAGVDVEMTSVTMYENRMFPDDTARPRFLREVLLARNEKRMPELEEAVLQARFNLAMSPAAESAA